jgi:hypothetical protein
VQFADDYQLKNHARPAESVLPAGRLTRLSKAYLRVQTWLVLPLQV